MCVCVSVEAPLEAEANKEEAVKVKELSLLKLGAVLAKHGFAEGTYM